MVSFTRVTVRASHTDDLNNLQVPIEQLTAYVQKTANYTAESSVGLGPTDAGDRTIACDTSAGAWTLSLPPAATFGAGNRLTISKVDVSINALTIDAAGSETIDGNGSIGITGRASLTLISTGSNWIIESGRSYVQPATWNVRDFGAKGDGVTDDTAAIQQAVNTCGLAGGGQVYVPPGDFFLNTEDASAGGGLLCFLTIASDNIWLGGAGPSSRLFSTKAGAIRGIMIEGNGKPSGHAGWDANRYQNQTVYAMNPVTAGDTVITLVTAAQAANFAAGDFAYLRTGQLTGGSSITEPDAEIVQIKSVNVGAGTITLTSPVLKDYVQEYFISGTSGLTTRAVTANPAAFGISNVNAMTIQNARISDLTIDLGNQSSSTILGGGQCWGLTLERLILTGADVATAFGDTRHLTLRQSRVELTREVITSPSAGIAAKGSADVLVDGVFAESRRYPVNWQCNEGLANLTFINNTTISGPNSGSATVPFGSVGRPRNHIVRNNTFLHSGTGAIMSISIGSDRAATGCGGAITGNILVGAITSGIGVDAPGFLIKDNVFLPSTAMTIFESLTWWTGTRQPTEPRYLWAWVTSTTQNPTLGVIPVGAWPIAVYLHVFTAFDSDGTDQISVGTDGVPNLFGALTDVSTTGVKTVALATTGYRSSALITEAYYVNGGSEPLHGRALVGVAYVMTPQLPAEGA